MNQLTSALVLTPTRLTLVSAFFLTLTANFTFFKEVTNVYPWAENAGFVVSLSVLLFMSLVVLISIVRLILPARVAVTIMLIIGVMSAYFTDQYGTVIDSTMLRNMLETNVSEASDLMSGAFWMRLGLFGIIPVLLIWMLPWKHKRFITETRYTLQTGIAAFAMMLICIFSFSEHYASFFREHKLLRFYTNPAYPIYSAGNLLTKIASTNTSQSFTKVAEAANTPPTDAHHELVILVVGETARADHWSLNGYSRDTTPELTRLYQEGSLINFSQVASCGTSTAISVPCMFSFTPKSDFDVEEAHHTENVLDVIAKAGVSVLWRDNNSNSKGVADRVEYVSYRSPDVNTLCDIECRDTGMLVGLQAHIDQQPGDILIVLHQMGSHGPAYFKRYPAAFERFTPVCKSAELSSCSQEEIINAYDNTILYTDHFLAETVKLLKNNNQRYETTLVYMSDHGESLGEDGVYLHGMPYLFAPDAQTHVPFMIWAGEHSDVDVEQSQKMRDKPTSQDNLSYTLFSLFEIASDISATPLPAQYISKENYE
ncbi:phosphoethanolamine transferase [Neptunomonas qingdaonensis]|uniref:Lipid A ethanolaminephosphotransferase n=1 Tax=Neptunomonas qingdaonensis TaxID=1045558 RepID=A0A1I2U4V8_9GAMM|nr:phosphoethanolamine--lipid A transferase [Neptunomonas qingdaonensis]SFG72134.1 lipid A ethanolaminephosphotransferase [Neptunomonas qingdaonensis]